MNNKKQQVQVLLGLALMGGVMAAAPVHAGVSLRLLMGHLVGVGHLLAVRCSRTIRVLRITTRQPWLS